MSWHEGRLCAFDLETTAPEPEEARIVTAAIAWVGGGQDTDARSWLADPGVEIPEEATEIHGITTDHARENGQPVEEVLAELATEFGRAIDDGIPVIIHNARYDLTVSDRELRRRGLAAVAEMLRRLRVVDPIVIEKHLDRYRPKRVASHSLEDCCRVWNVVLDGAHDATFDAIAAARLAYRLAASGRVIRRVRNGGEAIELQRLTTEWEAVRHDLVALHDWQRRIAWAEAERLEAYFRQGDPRKDVPAQPDRVVPREWPIIPYAERSVAA